MAKLQKDATQEISLDEKPNNSSCPHSTGSKPNNSSCPHSTGSKLQKAATQEISLDERPALQKSVTCDVDITLDVKKKNPKDGEALRHGELSRPLPNAV